QTAAAASASSAPRTDKLKDQPLRRGYKDRLNEYRCDVSPQAILWAEGKSRLLYELLTSVIKSFPAIFIDSFYSLFFFIICLFRSSKASTANHPAPFIR